MSDPEFPKGRGPALDDSSTESGLAALARELELELSAADTDLDPDDAVPMLTDVVQLAGAPVVTSEVNLPTSLDAVNWTELAEQVRNNVLGSLAGDVERRFDEHIAGALRPLVDRVTESLRIEMRPILSLLVKDLVEAAVNEELVRIHAEINRQSRPGTDNPEH